MKIELKKNISLISKRKTEIKEKRTEKVKFKKIKDQTFDV